DGRARIWSAESGRRLHVLRQGPSLDTVSFSPDGKLLVAGGGDGTARIWGARTGRLVHELRGHSDDVVGAVFSPSGRLVATASSDGTVRLYTCGICARIPGLVRLAESRLAQASRGLTAEQRRRYLP